MTISIIGDSISSFKDYIPFGFAYYYPFEDIKTIEDTWWNIFIKKKNLILIENNSFSGSRISNSNILNPPSSAFSSQERIKNYNSDFIIIFGGTNDYGAILEAPSLNKFKNQYELLLKNLINKNPNSIIYCCTPLKRLDKKGKNLKHFTLCDISKAIISISKKYNCKIINLYNHKITKKENFFIDGLHPNKEGMRKLANWIEEEF